MPLYWAHAKYVSLMRSHKDGIRVDRIEPVYQRYAKDEIGSKIEMWTLAQQPQGIAQGKTLRIFTEKAATIHWSFDRWRPANDLATRDAGFGCWFGDLPSAQLQADFPIVFTLLWKWDGRGKIFRWGLFETFGMGKEIN
jgi:hypothetical protein